MGRALLVGGEIMVDSIARLIKLVINIKHLTARVTENIGNTLLYKRFNDNARACHFLLIHKNITSYYTYA